MNIRFPQHTVADYCEMFARKEVRVNRDYQRSDQVWPRTAQSFLIETILLNFPIPKLFLHQKTDPRTEKPIKEIVDGQQRTRAIVDYFNDEYALTSNVTLSDAVGRRYQDLPDELKQQFRDYGLFFDLFVGASDEEVREVFRRMNSFTVPLNPEERRHAAFQGEFKWWMRKIATEYAEAIRLAGILGQKPLVRMQDTKLLTEIVAALFDGIRTTNSRTLDAVYRRFDRSDAFDDNLRTRLESRLRNGLDTLLGWRELHGTPLMKPHQIYALLLAVVHVQKEVPALASTFEDGGAGLLDEPELLVNLSALAEVLEGDVEQAPKELRKFAKASSKGTNVGPARITRFQTYCEAIAR